MADVDVKNQSSNQASTQPSTGEKGSLQRQGAGGGLSRSGGRDPFGFGLSPAEFFSSNPFTLMRRMSEEMDRTFGQFFGETRTGAGSWYPAIEVAEQNNQLQVHAELPGLNPEDVRWRLRTIRWLFEAKENRSVRIRPAELTGRSAGMAILPGNCSAARC